MFFTKTMRVVGLVSGGVSVLLGGLTAVVTTNVINQDNSVTTGSQGPVGPTGPAGSNGVPGSQGPVGPSGEDGREVEFNTEDNKLVWRYEGETAWNVVDLDLGGSSSFVSTGGSSNEFTHWIFGDNRFVMTTGLDSITAIADAARAAYAQNLVTVGGYTAVDTIADLLLMQATPNGKYVLTDNIDLSTRLLGDNPSNLIDVSFSGILDGAGYKILNFEIDQVDIGNNILSVDSAGIFKSLEKNATIRNLTLEGFDYDITSTNFQNFGTIAASVLYNSEITIENVTVKDFIVNAVGTHINNLGGLVGLVDSQASINLNQVSVQGMQLNTNNNAYSIGGIFGKVNGNISVVSLDMLTDLSVNKIIDPANPTDPINPREINRVGGVIGYVDSNNLRGQFNNTDVTLSGLFNYEVGGFSGYTYDDAKLFFDNFDVDFDVEFDNIANTSYTANYFGGLMGRFGDDSFLLANDITTTGSIKGQNYLGGLIGYTSDNALIRIDNSENNIDFVGSEYLGGFIGYTADSEDQDFTLVYINDSINNGSFTSITENLANNYDNNVANIGGFIGEFDYKEYDDFDDIDGVLINNQLWINGSTTNTVVNLASYSSDLVEGVYLYDVGGAVGALDNNVIFRASNNTINLTINSDISDRKLNGDDFYVSGVGGVVGGVEDGVTIQLANNDVSFNFNSTYSNNTSDTTELIPNFDPQNYHYYEINDVGGAFGEVSDDSLIVDVESTYEFNMSLLIRNNVFSGVDFSIEINDIGGYGGDFEDEVTTIVNQVESDFVFNVLIEDTTVLLDSVTNTPFKATLEIEIDNVGSFVGRFEGIGFIVNYDATILTTIEMDEVAVGITFAILEYNIGGFTGTKNPFLITPEEN